MTHRIHKAVFMGLVIGVIGGCAGSGESLPDRALTYQWVPADRQAEVAFNANESACQSSGTVSGYEQCMASRGYELRNR